MTPITHSETLWFLIQVGILLFAARFLGEVCRRFGQPAVLGEIGAGLLLGPSALGIIVPEATAALLPHGSGQLHAFETFTLLGVMFLLLITGLEIDFGLVYRYAKTATATALGGLIIPLIAGFSFGRVIPESLHGPKGAPLVFSLFLATAMAISAIPVLAKVLLDLSLFRRKIGQTILAAAMIDDATGWVLLSIVIGLAAGDSITVSGVATSVFSVVGFIGFMLTIGKRMLEFFIDRVGHQSGREGKQLSLIVVAMFIASAVSHALHLEALLGAFTVGMALSLCSQVSPSVIHSLEAIALRIFAPVFFAAAGLKVSVTALLVPGVWEYALLLLLVAILCKGVGVFLGARFGARANLWEAVFYASGLNARGSMEIVVASIGLSLGVLSAELFSAIVMVAVITSVMAPPAMRYALRRIPVDPEEEARLERELRDQSGLIGSMQKVLLPVRARVDNSVGSTHAMQALLLTQLAQKRVISLTLFSVAQPGEESVVAEYLDHLMPTFSAIKRLNRKVVTSTRAGDEILDEIRCGGYDLVVMGTPEAAQESPVTVFSPLIDYVLRLAPCATILIQGHEDVNLNDELSRVLVPTNGSTASRRAAEIGFSLLGEMSDEVVILKVVEEEPNGDDRLVRRQVSFGRAVVEDLAGLASSFGVQASGSVVVGSSPEEVILSRAVNDGIGLIILGTDVRVGEHRLYLGARVERILQRSPCPVMIVNG